MTTEGGGTPAATPDDTTDSVVDPLVIRRENAWFSGSTKWMLVVFTVMNIWGKLNEETPEVLPSVRPYAAWLQNASTPGRPWLVEEGGAEPLDVDGIAYRLPKFLSVEECEHIINNVVPRAGFHLQVQDRHHRTAPLVGANLLEPSWTRRYQDGLNWTTSAALGEGPDRTLARIEKRIAALTALPFHDMESPLMISIGSARSESAHDDVNSAPAVDAAATGGIFVRGLHHDHNQRDHRTATIIIYLTAGVTGGDTLFPCLRPLGHHSASADDATADGAAAEPAEPPAVCKELISHYRSGQLAVDFYGAESSGATMSYELTQRVRAQCGDVFEENERAPSAVEDGYGLLVRPVEAGDALLFLSVIPEDGTVMRHAWHTGCPVGTGGTAEKVTLQKFKEVYAHGQINAQGMVASDADKLSEELGSCPAPEAQPEPTEIP